MHSQSEQFEIRDLHAHSGREELLRLNNASASETSLLTAARFEQLIDAATIALFVPPAAAMLLAFEHGDNYDGTHFGWFRGRMDQFLYVDRIVVGAAWRRHGLARKLYREVFRQAAHRGHRRVVCEVNLQPPNPISDALHHSLGFEEVGRTTIDGGAKTVRYLCARLEPRT
ncbi:MULTISPECIES: GNAT family N-acetyltransferase [unclassified Bradyrhizobium]|uniref:GNAT family N-acetyltransferase n=1 Tax=unclassified Bradyrhizobium TaxID=2631580 RepID=UPI00040A90F0|nr:MULTISPECIES: GNAT family N-acetyltransferase [unclassified Bradyrhizobium]QIG91935.1 GNAT family N-acetyltransferase [Bradyrhizobium sp. 6(2017)]